MNNEWRLSKEEYAVMKKAILAKKETTDDWARVSMSGELSRKELMCRIMMNNDPTLPPKKDANSSFVCLIYAVDAYELDEEFLKDIIYINSSMALLGCWDERVIEWVLELYSKKVTSYKPGNVLEDVKSAIKSELFKVTVPEYHRFLVGLIADYNRLCKSLVDNQAPYIDNAEALAKIYLDNYRLANAIHSYKIPITDRLNWDSIETRYGEKLSYQFLKLYSKKPDNFFRGLTDKKEEAEEEDEEDEE